MILVTGANGTVGSEVVKQLLEAGQKVRVLVRDPAKAAKFGASVEVAEGDLSKPATLAAAFKGADKVFLSRPGRPCRARRQRRRRGEGRGREAPREALGPRREPGAGHHRRAVASGRREEDRGVGHRVDVPSPGRLHDERLRLGADDQGQGAVYAPLGEGKSPPIDPRDIAAVAVAALTKPGHEGKAYDLTGPEALTMAEQVKAISHAIGKPLAFVDVPEAAAREGC